MDIWLELQASNLRIFKIIIIDTAVLNLTLDIMLVYCHRCDALDFELERHKHVLIEIYVNYTLTFPFL